MLVEKPPMSSDGWFIHLNCHGDPALGKEVKPFCFWLTNG